MNSEEVQEMSNMLEAISACLPEKTKKKSAAAADQAEKKETPKRVRKPKVKDA